VSYKQGVKFQKNEVCERTPKTAHFQQHSKLHFEGFTFITPQTKTFTVLPQPESF